MTESIELKAAGRDLIGKANRRLAGGNRLAAVVYGVGHAPQAISVDRHDFELAVHHGGMMSSIVKLAIDDQKPVNVIVKSIQRDAVKDSIQHVDFWAVNMKQMISSTVPIHFTGESAGVKVGGVMTHNLREVHIEALPADLPEFLEVDISALEIGDSLHVGDLTVSDKFTITSAADEIVCSVSAPKAAEVEEEVAAEGAEPEVIGEKSEESAGE